MGDALAGSTFIDGNDASMALPVLQAAVRERPEDYRAVYSLGICLFRARSYYLAEHSFRHAVGLRYGDARAHYYLGLSLELQQKAEQAAEEYRTAARLTPDFGHPRDRREPIGQC